MKILIAVILAFSSIGYSKTLIVSDIDDTIKVSHVRDQFDMVWYSQITTNPFRGMSYVYSVILNEDLYNNYEPDSEVIYVTNARDYLMFRSHTKFIEDNYFPKGKIFFQTSSNNADHKYNTIKAYLEKNKFDTLIMVGDNGQEDINFYSRITEEFKDRIFIRTYIRQVYGAPTEVVPYAKGQIPFVSPLEILEDLEENNLLSLENYYSVANVIAQEIIDDTGDVNPYKPQYFPEWLNCKNMKFYNYPELSTPQIEKAYEKIHSICR
jgi:hypothetical protein